MQKPSNADYLPCELDYCRINRLDNSITSLYPTMSPAELDFLGAHYTLLRLFSGGDMQGPWVDIEVQIYALN
jgi:hypothetical protein